MDGRTLGRWHPRMAGLAALLFLSLGPTVRPSDAQVGYDPARSPYRDFRRTSGFSFMSGWLMGDRGRLKIGHTNGQTYTFAFEVPIGGPASFHPSVSYAQTERYVIDPFRNVDERLLGPFPDDMMLIDLGLRFMLTGNKTWHGLAAYSSASLGMAVSMGGPRAERGGYEFNRKMTFTGGLGLRFLPTRHLSLFADGRVTLWRLHYPPDYYRPASPDNIPVLFPNDPDVDWTVHPVLSVGLGWNL